MSFGCGRGGTDEPHRPCPARYRQPTAPNDRSSGTPSHKVRMPDCAIGRQQSACNNTKWLRVLRSDDPTMRGTADSSTHVSSAAAPMPTGWQRASAGSPGGRDRCQTDHQSRSAALPGSRWRESVVEALAERQAGAIQADVRKAGRSSRWWFETAKKALREKMTTTLVDPTHQFTLRSAAVDAAVPQPQVVGRELG